MDCADGTGLMAAILCEMARPIADFNHYTLNTDAFLVDCNTVFSDGENNVWVQHSQGLVLGRKVLCFFFIQGFGVQRLLGDYGSLLLIRPDTHLPSCPSTPSPYSLAR